MPFYAQTKDEHAAANAQQSPALKLPALSGDKLPQACNDMLDGPKDHGKVTLGSSERIGKWKRNPNGSVDIEYPPPDGTTSGEPVWTQHIERNRDGTITIVTEKPDLMDNMSVHDHNESVYRNGVKERECAHNDSSSSSKTDTLDGTSEYKKGNLVKQSTRSYFSCPGTGLTSTIDKSEEFDETGNKLITKTVDGTVTKDGTTTVFHTEAHRNADDTWEYSGSRTITDASGNVRSEPYKGKDTEGNDIWGDTEDKRAQAQAKHVGKRGHNLPGLPSATA